MPQRSRRRRRDAASASLSLEDKIPFDASVRTGTLPNGLTYFIRQNGRPANRVALRLAVKAGSLFEADDQQGLAHLIEHMAFNGSTHFKPGELVSYFESTGARLGPHVNAYTSFDETVYMLDLPTDSKEVVTKGLQALADFAGGLSLDPSRSTRSAASSSRSGAGGSAPRSRVRDKQMPVLYYKSRYAERLPIGKPEILRNAPAARLRDFYDTWYRPERMAIIVVGDMKPAGDRSGHSRRLRPAEGSRAPAAPLPDATVPLHTEDAGEHRLGPRGHVSPRCRSCTSGQRTATSWSAITGARIVGSLFARMLNDRFDGAGAEAGREVSERRRRRRFAQPDRRHVRPERARAGRRHCRGADGARDRSAPRAAVRLHRVRAGPREALDDARSTSAPSTSATRTRARRTRRNT